MKRIITKLMSNFKKTSKICCGFMALFFVTPLLSQNFELVKDINPGSNRSSVENIVKLNGKLYFAAYEVVNGFELWVSDGTTDGTMMLKDINLGPDNGLPVHFYGNNGNIYFQAEDGANGSELWVTDGTSAGTYMVKDINSGPEDSNPSGFIGYNDKVYFFADDGIHGGELWVSDGTATGTHMVKDINTGSEDSDPVKFALFNNKIYFQANDGTHGDELWASDGTATGTSMVKDIADGEPIQDDSFPDYLTEYNGLLYFEAISSVDEGWELWVTDGTEAGTQLLKDIAPNDSGHTKNFIEFYGAELWVTDGSISGTQVVKDLVAGQDSGGPSKFIEFNNQLYFTAAYQSSGRQLWSSNGTDEGTTAHIPNNVPNTQDPLGIYTRELVVLNDALYFVANYDNSYGFELWKYTADALDVEEYKRRDIITYPNPIQDILHIKTNENHLKKINLYTISGKHLKSWLNKRNLDLSNFSNGIYLIELIMQNKETVVKKIIKN